MNYKNSKRILDEIKKANKILLAFHEGVDPDSIVSNLILRKYLEGLGKKVQLVYHEKVPEQFVKLYKINDVEENVDFSKFDFRKFDLFITVDVNEARRFRIPLDVKIPIKVVNIDHHASKNTFSGLKITDPTFSATAEMVFYLLEDFGFTIDKEIANLVLVGILTDTDSFNYNVTPRLFKTVSVLLENGANFDQVNVLVHRSNSLDTLKFWAYAINNIVVDDKYKFAYSAIPFNEMVKFSKVTRASSILADSFLRTIEGTDFGIAMTERKLGELRMSIRSRESSYNMTQLLSMLGGGGHENGGGAIFRNMPFDEAVLKALEITRKFVAKRKDDSKRHKKI